MSLVPRPESTQRVPAGSGPVAGAGVDQRELQPELVLQLAGGGDTCPLPQPGSMLHDCAAHDQRSRSQPPASPSAATSSAGYPCRVSRCAADVSRNLTLIGVLGVVGRVRFPCHFLGTRDVGLADVFRILKQGLNFFLYDASVFG